MDTHRFRGFGSLIQVNTVGLVQGYIMCSSRYAWLQKDAQHALQVYYF